MVPIPQPLVLTLKLDQTTFNLFDELRQQHFPPEKNFLPAHVTLFHALPGEHESDIRQTLQTRCAQVQRLSLHFPTPRFLGRGVAVDVYCPELAQLQNHLAVGWSTWLSRQDQQGYRPHITIQNKVASDEARHLYEQLLNGWKPFNGYGEGLLLWYYKGGPWALADEVLLTTKPEEPLPSGS